MNKPKSATEIQEEFNQKEIYHRKAVQALGQIHADNFMVIKETIILLIASGIPTSQLKEYFKAYDHYAEKLQIKWES